MQYVFSDDLPDGEVIVPIRTKSGRLIFPVRRGEMTERMLAGLNEAAAHVVGVGLAEIRDNEVPPERRE
ncbi:MULTISPECIES: hypothetical protein [Streptomyces]|uniref:hypothetical protein n=1 Tax=Streptomyces TaxID=1883 RepID=UPI0018750E24|nr:hypothetical protein [Streptomyces vinaceusdrappus]GHC28769.1 hypothetical protein GCM10010308_52520 [Streptomyces vinaceusdrappus]